jgi:hypothetical protein
VAAALLALPGSAPASHKKLPFKAKATISACRGESLTIAAQFAPARDATRRARRVIRHASLRLRFEAAPLYGRTRKSRQFDLGRVKEVRRSVRFADLRAQGYSGIVRYQWKRGKRTVLSGLVRTRKARVAGKRGKAFCSLRVGRRPADTTPPFIAPVPNDSRWYRGPLDVSFFVVDDLSGVEGVLSRVDGGPFVRGRDTTIDGEGSHLLEYAARDAAGNWTQVLGTTLRVDEHPPTTPAVTAPTGSTTDATPEIRWNERQRLGARRLPRARAELERRYRLVEHRADQLAASDQRYRSAAAGRLHGPGRGLRQRRAGAVRGHGLARVHRRAELKRHCDHEHPRAQRSRGELQPAVRRECGQGQ